MDNNSIENIGSDQAQMERDGNDSTGMCQDVYNANQKNKLFDIDNINDKAISDGEEDSPDKNTFGEILMMNNGSLDIDKTAKKP